MGKHTCLHYGTLDNLLEFLAPYFEQGFRSNELCVWIVPSLIGVEGARTLLAKSIKDLDKYMEKGQLELLNHEDLYFSSGEFKPDQVLERLSKKSEEALNKGYSGLCGSGDVSWLQEKDWDKWIIYESALDKWVFKNRIKALCTFPVDNMDANKMFILSLSHEISIRKKGEKVDFWMSGYKVPA